MKRLGFALLPAALLLGSAELLVRSVGLASSRLRSLPLPTQSAGLLRHDPLLFWSLRPRIDRSYLGTRVSTNAHGLRSPELPPKAPGEYRILSLGESTTFGSGVEAEQTYTARLEAILSRDRARRAGAPVRIRAINAGVPAYSSFQSLKYLEERGLGFEPDLVLFYHEANDYLPSSLRDSSNNEIGVLQTDWELWESRRQMGWAALQERSALLRAIRLFVSRRRVEAFDSEDFPNPLQEIGLPSIGIPPRMMRVADATSQRARLNERSLGRRVSEPERRRILERLFAIADERHVELVVIHPAYRDTRPHECLLTRVAAEAGARLLDAYPALHPPGAARESLFFDSWHPRAGGHARLAEAIAAEIRPQLAEPGG